MTTDDLSLVLAWRNHIDIRRFMYSQHEITLAEHEKWFDSASRDRMRHLLIYEQGDLRSGFVNFRILGAGGVAEWGFYVAPDSSRGTGRRLGDLAIRYGFSELQLHKLCAQALAFNQRSIKFHLSLGFLQEGILQEQYFDGERYHDVFCFGLLAAAKNQ